MQGFDRAAVSRIVSDLDLAPPNRALALHWLSLWSGNTLPARQALQPSAIKPLLSNLIMFDVVPDSSVAVRLAGTNFTLALGAEITGQDWLALAPESYRRERLRIFTDIALGAIGRGIRTLELSNGQKSSCEEILLPLACNSDREGHSVVCHLDWNPGDRPSAVTSREQACGAPLAFETILLPVAKAA